MTDNDLRNISIGHLAEARRLETEKVGKPSDPAADAAIGVHALLSIAASLAVLASPRSERQE